MESYPTGPPTCGSSEDPTCEVRITDMSQGGPLVVFSFWILVFVVVLSFQLYRAWYARMHPFPPLIRRGVNSGSSRSTQDKYLRSPTANAKVLAAAQPNEEISTSSSTIAGAATELKIEVEEAEPDLEPILRFTGYHRVVAGEICWWLLILTSLQWICIYVVVLVDTYYSCQLTGIDNLCFFGTYFIFGSYDRNGKVFFTIWCISVLWFTVMVVYKREVHNWFMMPCGLSRAHVVHVWAQERQEILSINASRVVHLVRRLKGTYFFRPEQRGHTERLLVLRTEFGTPYFLFQGQRYLIAGDNTLHLARVELGHTYDDFYKLSEGLSGEEALARYDKVGPNEVPFKVETMWVSIAEEMFTLFKVYQFLIYSIWLWFSYLLVGALLFSIVLIAATITIINRRRSQSSIAKLIEYESIVEVKRDNTWRNVDFRVLVPGDVVKVKSNWKLPCDLLILQGICVCNESDLTGEAMPVHKYKARPEDGEVTYEPESARGARHTLFSGTLVLQAGAAGSSTEVLAIVTATGMSTSRGRLLSAILFPEQMVFKYDEELPVVVGMLLCYAAVCFALSLIFQYRNGQQGTWITKWSYCVAIVSQIVSPLLPVALEIGQIYASRRLKIHGVYCLNTKRIAIAGKIRVFCFDKTGTLTNDGLDFVGIQGVENSIVNNESRFRPTQSPWKHELIDDVILRGFATCHAVTKFRAQFVGNEVEVKMFSSVGWDLLEEGTTATQQYPVVLNKTTGDLLTIVRRNEFEHSRATMSVVVQDHTGELHVYCKGSFERIQELSTLESLPLDYLQTAKDHALNGCYVLGLSHKSLGTDMSLDAIRMLSRDDLETGLTFISLLLFRNELKSDTRIAIENLREGEVRPLMVTGDNAQCGFYIAKECAMVVGHVQVLLAEIDQGGSLVWQPMARTVSRSTTVQASLSTREMLGVHQKGLEGGLTELAVTGKAFNKLCSNGEMQELLLYTRIFSRCTPEDKVKVIKMHKDLGLVVGMCGDGGNDCGALRSAHAGLALSEAEASVVSPFTSKAKSVSSVVELLREGRAALHTSFACYKFLIIYGLSFSIFKLSANWYGVLPCQMDYLFIDGVAVLTLGYTMNLSNPMKTLRKERPTSSLLGAQNVASIFGMWSINVLFVAGALTFMSAQSDYVKWPAQLSQGNSWWLLGDNWESTVIFFTIYLQFIASSVVFTFGSSFRRTLFRNYLLVGSWAGIFVVVSLALMLPHSSFTHLWHVASEQFNRPNTTSPVWVKYQQHGGAPSPAMSFSFRLQLWVLSLANFVIVAFWQKAVLEGPVAAIIRRKFPSATPKLHL